MLFLKNPQRILALHTKSNIFAAQNNSNLMKNYLKSLLKILLPLALGGGILWWTYRDFDFSVLNKALFAQMSIGWLFFSLIFEVLSHVFRGLRWKQVLEPLGEHPRANTCINAIFFSYAISLLIPRSGEVARCGILKRYDGVSFTKSLGTVVTERVVDMVCVALIALIVMALQFDVIYTFFSEKSNLLFKGYTFWVMTPNAV